MPKTLVTGANGWLGTGLVKSLVNGIEGVESLKDPRNREIKCLILPGSDSSKLEKISKDIEIIEGDIRNKDSLKEFFSGSEDGTLFHCAGIIHPSKGIKEFYEVNFKGTENLLQLAEESKIKRAIVVSSNSPFGTNKTTKELFNESSPYNPYMGYGKSKMEMEKVIKSFQEKGNLETVIIRAPWFYGPNQPPRQSLFFQMVKNGKAPIVGSGNNLRSMTYIENLCQGLMLAEITESANGQAYWIADEKPYTTNEIVDTIEKVLEKDFNMSVAHKRMKLPGIASEVAFVIDGTLQSCGLYHQKIHVLSEMNKNIACTIQKAKSELSYKPLFSLEEGMKKSIDWCLKNGQTI